MSNGFRFPDKKSFFKCFRNEMNKNESSQWMIEKTASSLEKTLQFGQQKYHQFGLRVISLNTLEDVANTIEDPKTRVVINMSIDMVVEKMVESMKMCGENVQLE